jgi:hypothetical protein
MPPMRSYPNLPLYEPLGKFARATGLQRRTVIAAVRAGHIPVRLQQIGPGGAWYVVAADARAYLDQFNPQETNK